MPEPTAPAKQAPKLPNPPPAPLIQGETWAAIGHLVIAENVSRGTRRTVLSAFGESEREMAKIARVAATADKAYTVLNSIAEAAPDPDELAAMSIPRRTALLDALESARALVRSIRGNG